MQSLAQLESVSVELCEYALSIWLPDSLYYSKIWEL